MIMLTADAFGVLPPIARLTPAQAMYHENVRAATFFALTSFSLLERAALFCFFDYFG